MYQIVHDDTAAKSRSGAKVGQGLSNSKKSPTGPTERTPNKPEYLIDLAIYLGVRWDSVPFNFDGAIGSFGGSFGPWLKFISPKP